jgi:iron complex transport system substrate-binding protein
VLVANENTDVDLDALEQLAPVVVAPHDDSGDWREASLVYADAGGERDAMEQLLAGLDERAEALEQRLEEEQPGTVTGARADPEQLRLYGRAYFAGTVLDQLGVPRPAAQDVVEEEPVRVSYEQVDAADADTIFLYRLSGEDAARQQETLAGNPLWQRLSAVEPTG